MANPSTPIVRAIVARLATLNSHPVVKRWADLCWIRIPLFVMQRISRSLGLPLLDGVYLAAWPAVAALAPPLALLLGLFLGWLRFAPGDTFTWSITVMAVMVVVSGFGAALGVWLWLGYVIGDFFFFKHPVSAYNHTLLGEILHVRVPLLQTYILLAALLVFIPFLSAKLQAQINGHWRQQPRQARTRVAVGVTALLQGLLVFVWTQVAPILNGPLYTWSRYGKFSRQGYVGPPVEAMRPLVTMWGVLVVLAALAGGARVLLHYAAAVRPAALQTLRQVREGLMNIQKPRSWKLPAWAEILAPSVFATWMLAGLVDNVREAIGLAVVLAFIIHARKNLLPRMTAYVRQISRVPPTTRIIAGFAINFLIGQLIIGALWKDPYKYTWLPMLISVTLSLVVFALLLPETAGRGRSETPANTGQAPTPAGAGGRGQ